MPRACNRNHLDLTPAEARIYGLIVNEGLCNREIGKRTGWTYESVKIVTKRILSKLEAESRIKLVVRHWRQFIEDERTGNRR